MHFVLMKSVYFAGTFFEVEVAASFWDTRSKRTMTRRSAIFVMEEDSMTFGKAEVYDVSHFLNWKCTKMYNVLSIVQFVLRIEFIEL